MENDTCAWKVNNINIKMKAFAFKDCATKALGYKDQSMKIYENVLFELTCCRNICKWVFKYNFLLD